MPRRSRRTSSRPRRSSPRSRRSSPPCRQECPAAGWTSRSPFHVCTREGPALPALRRLTLISSHGRYDRRVQGAVHDRGGRPTEAPIDRNEHELADWELLADALVGALGHRGLMNVDELRRGIESMPPGEYERASYYERWLYSIETILGEKGMLAAGELDARLGA